MISIEEVWSLIDRHTPVRPATAVALADALGCALAEGIAAPSDLPPFDASAMDGYAFAEPPATLCPVVATIPAGGRAETPLRPGEAVRIFTGAPLPEGAFGVAKQEDCEAADGAARLKPGALLAPGENIRRRGGICRQGERLFARGTVIGAGETAWLAQCGIARVPVIRRPEAWHIATGSELAEPGEPLAGGQIYDSNGPMMEALLRRAGMPVQRRRLADSPAALEAQARAFGGDLLLISGGSGPGDHDHTAQALSAAGYTIHASRVNSRPGKPLLFATRGAQVAFGLPGNPLSHWVCYHAFVRRALARMGGAPPPELVRIPLVEPIREAGDGRRTWTPARLEWGPEGGRLRPLPWRHSGDLTPLAGADALILDGGGSILL